MLTFALVLARIGGLVIIAPVFSSPMIPRQLRIMLAAVLALVIAPLNGTLIRRCPAIGRRSARHWVGNC